MAVPLSFLSPREQNRLARQEGVVGPDGSTYRRGVKVSAQDAANSVATSAVNEAHAARTGEYGNIAAPTNFSQIGQKAYNDYLSPAPADGSATPANDFDNVSPFDSRALGYLDKIDPVTGLVKVPKARFKNGGAVHGPGTGTSDSIDAKLSNGEFVIPAHMVAEIGVENLDAFFGTDSSKKKKGFAEGGTNVNESLQYLKKLGYDQKALGNLMKAKRYQVIIDRASAELARAAQLDAVEARDKAAEARDKAAADREKAAQGYTAALQTKAVDKILELIKSPAGVQLLATPHIVAVKGGGEYGEATTQQEVRPAIVFANPAAPTDDELESAATLLLGAGKGDPLATQAQRVTTDVDKVQGAAARAADAKAKSADQEYQFQYERTAKMGPVAPDLRPTSSAAAVTPAAIAAEAESNRAFLENKQQVAQAVIDQQMDREVARGTPIDVNYAGGPGAYYSPDAPGVKFATLEELRMATTPVSPALPVPTDYPKEAAATNAFLENLNQENDQRLVGQQRAMTAPTGAGASRVFAPEFSPSSPAEAAVMSAARSNASAPTAEDVQASRRAAVEAQGAVPSFFSPQVTGEENRGRFVNAAAGLLDPFRDQIAVAGIDPTKPETFSAPPETLRARAARLPAGSAARNALEARASAIETGLRAEVEKRRAAAPAYLAGQ